MRVSGIYTPPAVAHFVSKIVWGQDAENCFYRYTAQGVVDSEDLLVGGVVYHDWDPYAGIMQMTWASSQKNWLNRRVLHDLLDYPFRQAGVQLLTARTKMDNMPVLRLAEAIGFDRLAVSRLFGRGADGFLLTLTDDDWRVSRFNLEREDDEQGKQGSSATRAA